MCAVSEEKINKKYFRKLNKWEICECVYLMCFFEEMIFVLLLFHVPVSPKLIFLGLFQICW